MNALLAPAAVPLVPALVSAPVPAPSRSARAPVPRCRLRRLRYEVYCLERRFVDAAPCAEGQESDEYDPHAVHFAATTVGLGGGHAPAGARFAAGLPAGSACGRTDRHAAGDGAGAHRGDLASHRGAGLSRRHHPPAADAVRPVPAPVRGVLPAGPRLPGGGMEGSLARLLRRLGFPSCRSATPSTILARWCPTAPRWRRCGGGTRTSSTTSGPASDAAAPPSATSA